MSASSNSRLSRINTGLLLLIIATNVYTLCAPIMPQLLFVLQKDSGRQQELERKIGSPATDDKTAKRVDGPDRLVIPAMLLDEPVIEGRDMYRSLENGLWRWPDGGSPDGGGNTVLAGHRFTYAKPRGSFYLLDKLKPGDTVGLVWKSRLYRYKVTESKVVRANQTEILKPTVRPTLTMYTCTPLWLPKDRLVVIAEPIGAPVDNTRGVR